jgi:16S rRNA (cytosine967-C5)-methyltransferase
MNDRARRTGRGPSRPRNPGRRDRGPRPIGLPIDEEREPTLPQNPREAALKVLHAVDTRSAFSDRVLDGAHAAGGDPRDQALLHELVKGTLRWRGRLDWALDQRVHVGLEKLQPWIKNVLRLGAYQVLFLDRVPPHAAVDESVKLANQYGHPGSAGLVNSVLRRLVEEKDAIEWPAGDDPASLAVWGSHPQWLVERWLARFGPEATRALLMANNQPSRVGLRVNVLRGTREALLERLTTEGYSVEPGRLAPELVWLKNGVPLARLSELRDGLCTAQDESEALVTGLVGPQPHERLLDLCAAPGGKSTHMAERIGDEGEVWAMDRVEGRVATLEATVRRLGVHAVHVVKGDGRNYPFPMPFDRVLVDAPCSGLGVLGRRADARWRKGPEILDEMPPIQLELLAAGGRHARPGGVLVYSVCSFEPEETTDLVEQFLDEHPGFILESADGMLPAEVVDDQGFMRVLPQVHGCDGAFAARFRKT